jgi:hypothetical protein
VIDPLERWRDYGEKPDYVGPMNDVLNPAFAPGTGTPEPGGLTSSELLRACRTVAERLTIVGADVVEVSPTGSLRLTSRRSSQTGSSARSSPASRCRAAARFLSETPTSEETRMCRNIHTLFNFEPPTTEDEVRAAAEQYVRKVSGFSKPSQANTEAFARAVDEVSTATAQLLESLVTSAAPKDREVEAARARARAAKRFAAA